MRYLLLVMISIAQLGSAQNLVPNGSFEELKKVPIRWMANYYSFEQTIVGWTSPDQGSPDILVDKVVPRIGPRRPGLDVSEHLPRTGHVMTAIKTFGCNSHTTHCKEYLQIQLKEPLEKGETYYAEFWVCPATTSVKTKQNWTQPVRCRNSGRQRIWYLLF